MPVVSVKKVRESIKEAVDELLQCFLNEFSPEGRSVLIKPNLVEPVSYKTGQTTNPELVEAIVLWCKKNKASEIVIGEGPSYFQPASQLVRCFTDTGIADVADRNTIRWILFDQERFIRYENHSSAVPRLFHLSEHAFKWDYIINVPVPKTHYLTTLSIAMKNLKGFIKREDKPSFHYCGDEGIDGAVTELSKIIKPVLNIVDCTAPVHRNRDFILASTDIVAADSVTASVMGYNPTSVRTIELGYRAGLGEMNIENIDIIGDDIKNLRINLEQPSEYLKRVFPNLLVNADQACCGCILPLFYALKEIDARGIGLEKKLAVSCGRNIIRIKDDVERLFIGECTKKHRTEGDWLSGCPPQRQQVETFLISKFT